MDGVKWMSVVVFAVLGCSAPELPTRASGSLAVSSDSALLYAADTDNGVLLVLDAKTLEKKAEVKVGLQPFRVAVGADGTVYVANRGSRSVSVVSPGDWTVVAELPTGVDPVGLQLNSSGKTLYVVSATALDDTSFGTLTAFDTATRESLWTVPVGEEPRGLGLLADDRAVVSLFKTGQLVEVDLKEAAVANANLEFFSKLNANGLTQGSSYFGTTSFSPRAMTDVATTPDGTRAFATAMLSRDAPILTRPTPDTPYYKGQGPKLIGSVSTSALITLERRDGLTQPLVDDVSSYPTYNLSPTSNATDFPQTSFAVSGSDGNAVHQGPSVAVVDPTGEWVFVVNKESSTVAIVSANRHAARPSAAQGALASVHSSARVAAGADGIAILSDNKTAFVYSQYEHQVQRLELATSTGLRVAATSAVLIADTLTPGQAAGRKLFHDANNRSMSAVEASVACSSCHLEGRDDGHTWEFPDGPRQTPTLAGRGMAATAPYHWSGEFADLQAFLTHTITARMGGQGLSQEAVANLNAYVAVLAQPESPFQQSPASVRGAQVFEKAQCSSCHTGQWLTNNTNADVGSLVLGGNNPDNGLVMAQGINVPSLKGLSRSAPYLHDGSVPSIKARVLRNPYDRHGVTSTLTSTELDDLVAYLQTL